jgi:hypothetical protein
MPDQLIQGNSGERIMTNSWILSGMHFLRTGVQKTLGDFSLDELESPILCR